MGAKIIINEPESAGEAWAMVWFGLTFLFWGKKKVVSLMWGIAITMATILWKVVGVPAFESYVTDRVTIKQAAPREIAGAKPSSSTFNIMPEAYAETSGDPKKMIPIVINGKFWAYQDTNYMAWKILDENVVFVWDKEHKTMTELNMPALEERIHEQKKQ